MNAAVYILGAVAVLAILWLSSQSAQNRRAQDESRARNDQLQRDLQMLAGQTQNFGEHVARLDQTVSQRLESVTQALQKGVTDSAQLAAQGQSAIAGELKTARGMMELLQKQMGEFQELGRGISQTTQTLEGILGGAKTRGLLGEVTLERLLEDSLPPSQYVTQYRFSSGEIVDAVIFLRDKRLMAIDSKFPLDAFRRIAAEGDEARRAFATAVKGHADSIASKYIVPGESTLEVALMFVPSETVYYELLMTQDAKGQQLDAYCRDRKVIAVSPNTLYAHLCVIAMGLRGMAIEENAKKIYQSLAGLQKQLGVFTGVFEKLGTHLKNAQQSYSESEKRLDQAQNTLGGLLGGDAAQPALETQQGELPLPSAKSARQGG